MKLRLPHKFQAALVAAIASVSFTTISSGTIAVTAGVLFTGQQARAAEDAAINVRNVDFNEDPMKQLDALDALTTEANEVGFSGNTAGGNSTVLASGNDETFDYPAIADGQAHVSSFAVDTPASATGTAANTVTDDAETGSGAPYTDIPVSTAPSSGAASNLLLQTALTGSASPSTLATPASLGSVEGSSGGAIGNGLSITSEPEVYASFGSAVNLTSSAVATPSSSNAAGWFVRDADGWTFSGNYSGNTTTPATFSFNDASGAAIRFNVMDGSTNRATYTFAVTVDLSKLSVGANTSLLYGGEKVGIGMTSGRTLTPAIGATTPQWNKNTITTLGNTGTVTIVTSTGASGSYYLIRKDDGTIIYDRGGWDKLKEGADITSFTMASELANAATAFAAWQTTGTLEKSDMLQAAKAMFDFPLSNPTPAETETLGNWMAIGDSITHGTNEYSYRWGLQKIFTDNGITYDAIGVQKTGFYAGYDTASYGGSAFDNEHCAQFNVKTEEIAGTATSTEQWYGKDNGGRPTSLWYSNVQNWLGLSENLTNNQGTYPHSSMGDRGTTFTGESAPGTYTIMLGSNDLNTGRTNEQILSDVATILTAAQQRAAGDGKTATVYMMSVPYAQNTLSADKISSYNYALRMWVADNKDDYTNLDIRYVNINDGFKDVTGSTAGGAVASMLQDWAHPTAQGNLIISGNLARGMGYAGRTAGQERKAATNFEQNDYAGGFSELPAGGMQNVTLSGTSLSFASEGASTATFAWDNTPTGGYTVDFSMQLGNGAAAGWDTATNFSVTLGDDYQYGTLNVNEAYIKWGNTILYSRDASTEANLRVAYVQGDSANDLMAGYYVWLGDQLIGEACSSSSGGGFNGVTFSYSGTAASLVSGLAMDSAASWAPTSNLTAGENGYRAETDDFRIAPRQGLGDFTHANEGAKDTEIISGTRKSGDYYYAYYGNGAAPGNLGNCHVWSFGTSGAGSANLHFVTYGLGNGSTAETARLAGAGMNFHTVHGLYHTGAATMSADVLTQLDSAGGTFGTYHGSEKMSSTGKIALVMNEGTITGDVVGGFAAVANNTQSINATEVYINYHGVVEGSVYGGSTANGTVNSSKVVVTGGRIGGSVYGGGTNGTVGTASVEISGGEITGNVYGGGNGDTVTGTTSVTIKTYLPAITGNIFADSVTISDLQDGPDTDTYGFDKYQGTITADTITLNNTTVARMDAALVTKTLVLSNNTHTTITNLTLTACEINADSTSAATLAEKVALGGSASYTGSLTLADDLVIDVAGMDLGDHSERVALFSTSDGTLNVANLNSITVEGSGVQQYYLTRDNSNNLYINFGAAPSGVELVWNGGNGTWNTSEAKWHTEDAPSEFIAFQAGNDVRFDAASDNSTVTLGEPITAGNMTIDRGVTVALNLNSKALAANFKGAGTVILPTGQKALPAGVTLDSTAWAGIVQISGSKLTALDFKNAQDQTPGLATANSAIELKGVSGWMNTNEHNANLILTNNGNTPALEITNGSNGSTTTLSGKISGSGTIRHNWGGGDCTFKLTGDLSEWTGDFNKTGGKTTTLALTDNASTIAPDIKNTGSGTLNVNINNANAVTLTGDIAKTSGTLNLNIGNEKATNAKFTGDVTVSSLAINKNSSVAFAGGAGSLGTISLNGNNNAQAATILRFSPSEGVGTGAYTATTITMSSNGNAGLKWVVVDQNASLELTGTNVGSGGGSSIANAWGVSGGGLEVNGILTSAGTISMDGPGSSTFKGAGQINAAGLNISNGNTATIQGGLTINITSATGIYKRTGNSTLNIGAATLKSEGVDWQMNANLGTVNLTDSSTGTTFEAAAERTITVNKALGGSGKLVKAGVGTLAMGAASTYTGGTAINAGTVVTSNATALGMSTVTIANDATLKVTGALTIGGTGANNYGVLDNSHGGTLSLTGGAALTLNAGSANRTYNLGNVVAAGSASIRQCWFDATVSINSIHGDANATLALISDHSNARGVWNIGQASGTVENFTGTLVLQSQDTGGYNDRAADFKFKNGDMFKSATLELRTGELKSGSGAKTMSNNIELDADEVSFGGITDGVDHASASSRTVNWTVKSDSETSRTLVLDAADGSYSTKAGIDARVNIKKTGASEQTFSGSMANFNGSVDVEAGVLNIMNATRLDVKDVTIGAGATLGVYKNGTSTEENEGKVTIAYGYTLSAGNLARLNADLEMQHGSLLDVSKAQVGTTDINGLIMGSSVTIQGAVYEDGKLTSPGTYLVYTDDQGVQHDALEEVDGYLRDYFATSGNQYYVLFNDVEELFLNGSTTPSGEIAFNGWDQPFTDANTLFSNVNQNTYAVVYSFNGTNVGTLAICLVPEPTTGTLSLLALCALAVRRRRK